MGHSEFTTTGSGRQSHAKSKSHDCSPPDVYPYCTPETIHIRFRISTSKRIYLGKENTNFYLGAFVSSSQGSFEQTPSVKQRHNCVIHLVSFVSA